MAKASDNPFPSLLLVKQAVAPATPASGQARMYRGTDNKQYVVDDTGAVSQVGGGAGGGSGQGLVDFARAKRTSGDLSVGSTANAWTNVDTGLDLVMTASAGDVVEADMSLRVWASSGQYIVLDFVTVVAGAVVNSLTTEGAPAVVGLPSWGAGSIGTTNASASLLTGSKRYTLVAGDIDAGTVRLRLRYRCSATVTMVASGDPMLYVQATNLGQQL